MKTISYHDIREGGPLQLLDLRIDDAKELMAASRDSFGLLSQAVCALFLPSLDKISKGWLVKSDNIYRHEIERAALTLGIHGTYALNMCYEWGCTSAIYAKNESAVLTRVLDWPFPKMGEQVVVAHQRGPAGDFYNVTWPAMMGVFNAMAPNRFAASLNQAPMKKHGAGFVGDWAINRHRTWQSHAIPPAHLLRHVFETARNYEEAKKLLCETPIALPVIYILSGISAQEGCVIERTEYDAIVRPIENDRVCASNQFETAFNDIKGGWLAREIDSAGRMKKASTVPLESVNEKFDWFVAPLANDHSRLAMMADAGKGTLAVMGTLGAVPVTEIFKI